jgi:nucleotide-binding universal stress UspA family protein
MSLFQTQRVLVPIDFSEASLEALAKTLDFVKNPDCVFAIHVLPPLSPVEPGVVWAAIDDESRRANVQKAFAEAWAEYCPTEAARRVALTVAIGDPGTEIADWAARARIKLIVIPSHGRTGLNRWLMRSVAERVARLASCPVLILHRLAQEDGLSDSGDRAKAIEPKQSASRRGRLINS